MLLIHKAIIALAIFTETFWHISLLRGALRGKGRGEDGQRERQEWARTCRSLLHAAAVVAQDFALLTQMLRVLLALV